MEQGRERRAARFGRSWIASGGAVARTRRSLLLALAVVLVATVAWAATYTHTAHHVTRKSAEHVYNVLTAYGQVCDSGCKYHGPDVVTFKKISHEATDRSWYTWTHVSQSLKHTKYYNEVRVTKTDGGFKMITRQLDGRDESIIKELEAKTGLEHNPVFDSGRTIFTVKPIGGGKTKVTQDMKLTASGMVTMFGGKIEAGMKEGAKATFRNIEK